MNEDAQKLAAAQAAVDYIKDGMVVGLGTGSTAAKMVDLVGARVKDGLDIVAVPTSEATAAQAKGLGIKVVGLDEVSVIDLTIDGTDEVDPEMRLIKGGGGAHLREKIVASLSDQLIIIAENKKMVDTLGAFKLPVEVVPFAAGALLPKMEALGSEPAIRQKDGDNFYTDEGNLIIDCAFGAIDNPEELAITLSTMAGVVEHGLFINFADMVLVGTETGVKKFEA